MKNISLIKKYKTTITSSKKIWHINLFFKRQYIA